MGNKDGFQERGWKKKGEKKKEVGGLAKKEQGSRDQESWERMCEEQLGPGDNETLGPRIRNGDTKLLG